VAPDSGDDPHGPTRPTNTIQHISLPVSHINNRRLPTVKVRVNGPDITAMIDTGAAVVLIDESFFKTTGLVSYPCSVVLNGYDGIRVNLDE
jgi:hypothetical protein